MIYLDNSATTKPYKEALHTFMKVNETLYANPSSIHSFGGKADDLIKRSREQVADLLGVEGSEVFFTSGGTESNNLAVKGTAMQYKNRGRHIITSRIEHPSVKKAVEDLEPFGFSITYVGVDEDGRVDLKEIEDALRDDTILVSVMHVNNEVGTIQPIREIGELLKERPKTLFHVDAVQACGKIPLDLHGAGVDLCSLSSHKIHGIKGTGALYVRSGVRLSPLLSGGEQEGSLRSGTENTGGIAAFAKALRMHLKEREESLPVMKEIQGFIRDGLSKLPYVTVHTPETSAAPHILNFSIEGFKGEVMVHSLDQHGIYLSTTSACSSRQHKPSETLLAMGVSDMRANSSLRVSLSYHTTMQEARMFLETLEREIRSLMKTMRRSR